MSVKLNINKLFPFLSIRVKLIIAFTMLSFIPLTIVGLTGLYYNTHTLESGALENLTHDVSILQEKAKNFLTNVDLDIQYLYSSSIFHRFLNDYYENNSFREKDSYSLVTQQILTFARTKKIYYQILFVDNTGNEVFRIQQRNGIFQVIPPEQLSSSRFIFYSLLTDSLPEGEMAVVPVELIDHRNRQKVSSMSFAIRINGTNGEYQGIFIANVFARDFFKVMESNSHLASPRTVAIVNSEGNYLYHSEKKKNWNRLLATREIHNIADEYSVEFSRAILSGKQGIFSQSKTYIAAYAPLFIAPFPGGNSYYLFESVEKSYVLGPANRFALIFIMLLLIFLAISISAGVIATSQLAGPIRELQRGAKIIARGNYQHHLRIETNDEIEQLAEQFNQMAAAIRDREHKLEEQQKRLEETVVQRTAELRNEKEKLQAILDNVPSAFLLIDEDRCILSASAAIQTITGFSPQKVIGKKCFDIFSERSICENCMIASDYSTPRPAVFIETQNRPDGETIFIEHISIPLKLNQHHSVFLEILTDITERKKFEEHLIETERMAATGEMAAVIAHEIRNSLTSIKMLLQLSNEGSTNEEEAEQTREVALQSIYRIEEVVNNLLRFARPAPYDFQIRFLNQLIEESILFVRPQLEKKQITLRKQLDPEIPEMNIDSNHMKEAFINLLLNAAQAIHDKGEISIHTKLATLTHQLDDFIYRENGSEGLPEDLNKVILPKGEKVVIVEIKDTGTGIPMKYLRKIFDAFFTTKLNGTGLGLTIVKRTVNQHGGIIRVFSKPGQGTTFQIILPVRRPV